MTHIILLEHDALDPPSVADARYRAVVRVEQGSLMADVCILVSGRALAQLAEAAATSESGRACRLAGGIVAVRLAPGRVTRSRAG